MGTSLIDAHAGGIGVIESIPASQEVSDGQKRNYYFCQQSSNKLFI